MDPALEQIIERSGLEFLKQWLWKDTGTAGRWFSEEKKSARAVPHTGMWFLRRMCAGQYTAIRSRAFLKLT